MSKKFFKNTTSLELVHQSLQRKHGPHVYLDLAFILEPKNEYCFFQFLLLLNLIIQILYTFVDNCLIPFSKLSKTSYLEYDLPHESHAGKADIIRKY
jgi:hypothetical protein